MPTGEGNWTFKVGSIATDPGAGNLNADTPLTTLALAATDADGTDRTAGLATLDTGDLIVVRRTKAADQYVEGTLASPPVSHTSWWSLPLTNIAGSLVGQPKPNDPVVVIAYATSEPVEPPPLPTLPALIEPAELASYMRRPELDSDPAVQVACQLASGAVRDYTQQTLTQVKDDTMTWFEYPYAPGPSTLLLPEFPVTSVSSVVRDGDVLALHEDYEWDTAGLIAAYGSTSFYGTIEVSYDHGFITIPEGLRAVVLACATRLFDNPARDVNRAVGAHNESYTVDFTLNEQTILARYHA